MTAPSTGTRQELERLLATLRPKLHRYCARMTGSVIDGEDVVQDALLKAIEAAGTPVAHVEGWVFRIAHNAALDFLRRRARQSALNADEDMDMIVDPANATHEREMARASLRTFMRLPVMQRSSVILMDVLGYSLDEIGDVTGANIAAVKAALHRGRERLREFSREPEEAVAPMLAAPERARLAAYVERFNAHDFDAVREMLAADVQLDLVSRRRMKGKVEVGTYFSNYAAIDDWRLRPALIDGRPAAVVHDPRQVAGAVLYFVLLNWDREKVLQIRDFRCARYALDGAAVTLL